MHKSTKKREGFWISFVEECWPNQRPKVMCRIEVFKKPEKSPYSIEEIHFCTDREEAYNKFQEKWDWKTITKKQLEKVRWIANAFRQEWLNKNIKRLDKLPSKVYNKK